MKIKSLLIAGLTGLATLAHAAVIYVDFGDDAGGITAGETYNTLVPAASGASTSLEGTGEDFSDLLDTTGSNTGVDLNVLVTSTGGDVRAGDSLGNHDPISGIDDNALDDGFWVNNGDTGTLPADVSFVLTFSSLGANPYNIQLTASAGVQKDTLWAITTGTGDAGTFTATSANGESSLGSWSAVTPVGGEIVITGTFTADGNFGTTTVNFVSLEAVIPEPSTLALLGAKTLNISISSK